jgi:hypothetical protein
MTRSRAWAPALSRRIRPAQPAETAAARCSPASRSSPSAGRPAARALTLTSRSLSPPCCASQLWLRPSTASATISSKSAPPPPALAPPVACLMLPAAAAFRLRRQHRRRFSSGGDPRAGNVQFFAREFVTSHRCVKEVLRCVLCHASFRRSPKKRSRKTQRVPRPDGCWRAAAWAISTSARLRWRGRALAVPCRAAAQILFRRCRSRCFSSSH